MDLGEDQGEPLLSKAVHFIEHAFALVFGSRGPGGFDRVSTVQQSAVFRSTDDLVVDGSGLRVGIDEGLAHPTSLFFQVVETFLHRRALGRQLGGFLGGRTCGGRDGSGLPHGFARAG
ncbi:MAG: hypothetical protein ACO3J6_05760 [Opitutales bacterium]